MEGVTVRTQDSDAEMRDAEQVGRSGVGRGPRQLLGDPGAALTERRRRIGASAIGRYQRARQRWHGWALGQWVAGAVNVWGRGQGSSEGRSQARLGHQDP